MLPQANTIEIKPYSLKELSYLYNVCPRTIKKWMNPFQPLLGKRNGRFFTVAQVIIIFDKLGIPAGAEE